MVDRDWPPLGRITFIARHWPKSNKEKKQREGGLAGKEEISNYDGNEVTT